MSSELLVGQWLPARTFAFFVLCCHFDNLFWNTGHYEGIQLWEFCPLAIKEPKLIHFFFLAVVFGFVLNAACMNTVPTSENIKMFVLIVTDRVSCLFIGSCPSSFLLYSRGGLLLLVLLNAILCGAGCMEGYCHWWPALK